MNKYIFLILFFLPLTMMAQKSILFEGLTEIDEIYYYNGEVFTGKSIRKYANNKKAQEAHWKNGKLHGLKKEWWESGAIREKMNFIAGYRHGEFTRYYDNGSLKIKENYEKDILEGTFNGYYRNGKNEYEYNYTNGVKNGMSTTFFDFSGKQTYANVGYIEQQVMFVDGVPHGELNSYYRAGNPRRIVTYNMGVLHGPSTLYHINALLAEEGFYKNGKKDSIRKVYDNLLGNLISQEFYKNGVKNGEWINYNQLGDTVTVNNYKDGVLHGISKTYEDRVINNIGEYVNGKKHGLWKTGQANNYKRREGSFNMGIEVGEWFYYDIDGKKLMRRVFDSEGYITEEDIL